MHHQLTTLNRTRNDDVATSGGIVGRSVMTTRMKKCTRTQAKTIRALPRPTRSGSHHIDTGTRSATRPAPSIAHHIDAAINYHKTNTMKTIHPTEEANPAEINPPRPRAGAAATGSTITTITTTGAADQVVTMTKTGIGTETANETVTVTTATVTASAPAATEETPRTTTTTTKKPQTKPPKKNPATVPAATNAIITTIMPPSPGTERPAPPLLTETPVGEHPKSARQQRPARNQKKISTHSSVKRGIANDYSRSSNGARMRARTEGGRATMVVRVDRGG